ncbi:glycosyltransferase family 4 protein [Algoriphagus limi]|uniref:Glycosyltransferase family 4 protein n=1 Tax=Algoriphagus limi TaxID=2975273 RepID=A0ABT2G269_9BACT|nr:glycosyltransferase family 4 protein [Algoriphagus limi]MCS5489177.1 glycosyltransferase family 4 protein [Algoriphagus limi]
MSSQYRRFVFINSHPIQYFAPLYKKMTDEGLHTQVWYASNESVNGGFDKEFGQKVKWDVPLLEGYSYRFFKNYSLNPSINNGFFGLLNLGMLKALLKLPKSLVIIHGWGYFTNVSTLIVAKLVGHTVGIRGESPLNQELLKNKNNLFFKRIFLKYFLFQFVDRFYYIGQQNRAFYKYFGVKESKLVFTPYAVDNERFQQAAKELLSQKKMLRQELGLPIDSKIILFSGKYIYKKRPIDLLQAYNSLQIPGKALVMVGEGELRPEMEEFIANHSLGNVFLTGFVNQREIVKYYAIADLFVMCSGDGETWGLATNEAMNFGIPIVLSDRVGCAADLINEQTGIIFPLGNTNALTEALRLVLNKKYLSSGIIKKINQYSYRQIIDSF